MQRQSLLQFSATKDACIFCITRLHFASARPVATSQRRFLRSTPPAQRPNDAEVAQSKPVANHEGAGVWRSAPPPRRHQSGSWESKVAPRELTPQEQELRDALRTEPPKGSLIRTFESQDRLREQELRNVSRTETPERPLIRNFESQGQRKQRRVWETAGRASGQQRASPLRSLGSASGRDTGSIPEFNVSDGMSDNSNEQGARGQESAVSSNPDRRSTVDFDDRPLGSYHPQAPSSQASWKRTMSPSSNNPDGVPRNASFRIRNSSAPDQRVRDERRRDNVEDRAVLVDDWKHVRRRVPVSSAKFGQHNVSQNPESHTDPKSFLNARAAEEERTSRIERTRNGRFVGFGGESEVAGTESAEGVRPRSVRFTSDSAAQKQDFRSQPRSTSHRIQWNPITPATSDPLCSSAISLRNSRSAETENKPSVSCRERLGALKDWEQSYDDMFYGAATPRLAPQMDTLTDIPELKLDETQATEHSSSTSNRQDISPNTALSIHLDGLNSVQSRVVRETPARGRTGVESTSMPYGTRSRYKQQKNTQVAYDAEDEDFDLDREEKTKARRARSKDLKAVKKATAPPTPINLPNYISVSNLAGLLKIRVEECLLQLKSFGLENLGNDYVLDADTAGLVAEEFKFKPVIEHSNNDDILPVPPMTNKSSLRTRAPVVTIMGHVDHGKTTLLDCLRNSSVAASEHGGITQGIGAFSVRMAGGSTMTCLDTPGHKAFEIMRQMGANVTDIIILVVAVDDSVKPQTKEAIKHATQAKVPMIVAITKVDKEGSDIERVKQDLLRENITVEDYGGDTQVVCVSGRTGQGMENLEEEASALAESLDIRAATEGQVEGWVLEATTKKAGRVATVLVRRGTLKPGNIVVAGTTWTRIRSLRNEAGIIVPSAGPSTPVEVDGWGDLPSAGDEVLQAPNEKKARAAVDYRLVKAKKDRLATDTTAINASRQNAADPTTAEPKAPGPQEMYFVVRTDFSGSVKPVEASITKFSNDHITPVILHASAGAVVETDVDQAAIAGGVIISFNARVDGNIRRQAEEQGVTIMEFSIIYQLEDAIKALLTSKLPPIVTQKVLGEAEIARIFEINTKGRTMEPVAGCRVRNGAIAKTAKVKVVREGEVVFDGVLSSLKVVKKDVPEVRKDGDCGMGFAGWTGFKQGDKVQAYEEETKARTL